MKVLILAAGYGTRLERDILEDKSAKFAHLVGVPKPLVPVGSVPLLTHWLLVLEKCPTINISRDVFIVCNSFNQSKFQAYLTSLQPSSSPSSPKSSSSSSLPSLYIPLSHLICDNTTSNDNRLGAIRDIDLFVTREGLLATNEDILVLGGDTLFDPQNFSLSFLLEKFSTLPKDGSLVLHHYVEDRFVNKTGILELADDARVLKFIEKPQPTETASRKACPCLYIYRSNLVKLLHEYVQQAKTLKEVDAPGTYIAYAHSRAPVYAEGVGRRFDIGGLETYIEANQFYLNLEKDNKMPLNDVYRKFETVKRTKLVDESSYISTNISNAGKAESAPATSGDVSITVASSSSPASARDPLFSSSSWLLQFIPTDVWKFIVNHHCDGVCPHTSCFLAAFRGFRQGVAYGAKVRFPHALVMTLLFGGGSITDKVNSILNATYAHSRTLGLYVMLYKSLQCVVRHIRQKESGANALIGGFLAGGLMFGENTPVNVQINMYVFSRVCFGLARTAVRRGYFSEDAHKWAYPLFAALSWSLVMYLFEFEKDTLQKSLISSMIYLYSDSNQWPADADGLLEWFVKG